MPSGCRCLALSSILLAVAAIMLARLSPGSLRYSAAAAAAAAATSSSSPPSPSPSLPLKPKAALKRSANLSTKAATNMSSSQTLRYRSPIVIPARQQPHTATVIVLHGLGDTGDGWAGAAPELAQALPHARFIFPHAPDRPISLNYGMKMPGWYDIKSLEDIDQREDREGILESQRYVLEELVGGSGGDASSSSSARTAVVGFSQGGAIALSCLRGSKKLAGVVGMSTYVPLRKEAPIVADANKETPILLCHGDADAVVSYSFGLSASELLKEATQAPVEFKTYRGMAHSACPEELRDVAAFLKKVLPPV
jgi:lysophospholipase-2